MPLLLTHLIIHDEESWVNILRSGNLQLYICRLGMTCLYRRLLSSRALSEVSMFNEPSEQSHVKLAGCCLTRPHRFEPMQWRGFE